MKIEMHLFEDYKAAAITRLRRLISSGLRVKGLPQGRIPDDEWFDAKGLDYYFEYLHRRIPVRPRLVRECSCFCCPDDLRDEYSKILDEITTGVDLSNRQTWRIDRAGSHDPCFNEWGLHHLHFSKRNGDIWEVDEKRILFIYVTDEVVYVIRVGGHGDFEDIDLVAELNKDYPQLFSHLKGAEKTSRRTKEDVEKMRQANVNVIDVLDGGALACLGGGMMANGCSATECMNLIVTRHRLDAAEKVIASKFQDAVMRGFPDRPDIFDRKSINLKLIATNDDNLINDDRLILKCEELCLKVGLRDKDQEIRLIIGLY